MKSMNPFEAPDCKLQADAALQPISAGIAACWGAFCGLVSVALLLPPFGPFQLILVVASAATVFGAAGGAVLGWMANREYAGSRAKEANAVSPASPRN